MILDRYSLSDQKIKDGINKIEAGEYFIEYHDATHHAGEVWRKILSITIYSSVFNIGFDESERRYDVRLDLDRAITNGQNKKNGAAVADAVSLALARSGLLRPHLSVELLAEVTELCDQDGIVIIPDTNALHNGAVHWLLRVLSKPSVWLFPLVVSLTQVQSRDAAIKGLLGDTDRPNNLSQALRSRSLVNGALGLLERNKGRCQIIELDPSLLRYQKTASKNGSDPDQSDVLEDRLIIEGIQNALRSMRSRTTQRVVTSDVNLGRVLLAEGIPSLFVPSIKVGEGSVGCIHYDPLARNFVGAPLRSMLWELAHSFGGIRIVGSSGTRLELGCYWPEKTPFDWQCEKLSTKFHSVGVGVALADRDQPTGATEGVAGPDDLGSTEAVTEVPVGRRASDMQTSDTDRVVSVQTDATRARLRESNSERRASYKNKRMEVNDATQHSAALPRASLPAALRLLGAVKTLGGATLGEILRFVGQDAPTADTAGRAFELLRRVDLVKLEKGQYVSTRITDVLDNALRADDLDTASEIFERFEPYAVVRTILEAEGFLNKEDVREILVQKIGPVGKAEAERLPRFHILLGQAYSAGEIIHEGSQRPTDRDAIDMFDYAFRHTAIDGLAKVANLLPAFCETARMSPWAARKRIEKFVAEKALPDYTFQPAAGGRPVVGDEVLKGSLADLRSEHVAIDRLQIGEQPVFTVGGPAR